MEISYFSLLLRIQFSLAVAAGRQEQHRYIIPVPELETRVPAVPGGGQNWLLPHHAAAGSCQGDHQVAQLCQKRKLCLGI